MRSYVPICSRSRSPAVGFRTLECRLSHRLFVSWTGFAKRTDFGSSASRYHHQLYPAFTSLPNTIYHLSHARIPPTNSSHSPFSHQHYTTLHYTTLQYTTPHYTTLHYTTLLVCVTQDTDYQYCSSSHSHCP